MSDDPLIQHQMDALKDYISRRGSMVVAYSGGVDSTLLALAAHEALGPRMLAVFAESPLLSIGEKQRALSVAGRLGIPVEVIAHPGFEVPEVIANDALRCYHCKDALFRKLSEIAREHAFAGIACGDNADDAKVSRPGARAAEEQGVMTPLADLGLRKRDIRAILRSEGADNWDLASSPCLATRFPTGCMLDEKLLSMVRIAEASLEDAYGFKLLRVRCDAEKNARIELSPEDLDSLSSGERSAIASILTTFGFSSVELGDYRMS